MNLLFAKEGDKRSSKYNEFCIFYKDIKNENQISIAQKIGLLFDTAGLKVA